MNMFSVLTNYECKVCNGLVKRLVKITVVGYAETVEAHCTKCGKDCMSFFYPTEES